MTSRFVSVSPLIALACIAAMIFGCRQACDPADSKAICAAVQECFEYHPAAACRERERIAIQVSKPNPLLKDDGGAAQALKY
jgi:hypothetical protein